jgi:hypothetical protein
MVCRAPQTELFTTDRCTIVTDRFHGLYAR